MIVFFEDDRFQPGTVLQIPCGGLAQAGQADIEAQGIVPEHIELVRELDVRYVGQSYELQVPFGPEFRQSFHERHQEAYGYSDPDMPIEVVNLRVRAIGRVPQPGFERNSLGSEDPADALISKTERMLTFYEGVRLRPGNRILGPSIILFPDTTAYLGDSDTATVDGYNNILVEVGHK